MGTGAVAPGYGPTAIPAIMRQFVKRPLEFMTETQAKYGDVARYRLGPFVAHQLSHPDHVHYVLQENNANYVKAHVLYDEFRPIVGDGLLTSEGEVWRRQRRLIQPTFRHENIAIFATIFVEESRALCERWEALAGTGATVDITTEMMQLTFAVVGRALFSRDLGKEADAVGELFTTALEETSHRADTMLFKLPLKIPTPRNRRLNKAVHELNRFVVDMIRERRRAKERPQDLMTMLIEATDHVSNESMTDLQLRDELCTFLLAGHETTAIALSWTWYLLAKHPGVAPRIREEGERVLGGRDPNHEDAVQLAYTNRVLQEAMRLFPPFWVIGRSPIAEDRIGEYRIPPKSIVLLPAYLVHRHERFWPEPEHFDPERFTEEAAAQRPRMAYFPFGGGQRQCIGVHFAILEALIVLAMVCQRYRLALSGRESVAVEPHVTLRAEGGIPMVIERI